MPQVESIFTIQVGPFPLRSVPWCIYQSLVAFVTIMMIATCLLVVLVLKTKTIYICEQCAGQAAVRAFGVNIKELGSLEMYKWLGS